MNLIFHLFISVSVVSILRHVSITLGFFCLYLLIFSPAKQLLADLKVTGCSSSHLNLVIYNQLRRKREESFTRVKVLIPHRKSTLLQAKVLR